MRKILIIFIPTLYMCVIAVVPVLTAMHSTPIAHAAGILGGATGGTGNGGTGGTGIGTTGNGGSGATGGTGNGAEDCNPQTQFCNPLQSQYSTLCQVLTGILGLITEIGSIIAVILIIWTGFKFITAQGNPKKLSDAKNSFYTTLLGTAILLGASGIAEIIIKTIFSITNKSNPGVCGI